MKIVCDSISDISKELIEKYDIEMLPLRVIIEGKEYLSGIEIDNDEYYKILKTSETIPTTSQVTYMDFKEKFEMYTSEGIDILYVGGSSKASGTFQSAVMASRDVPGPGRVYTFDTNSLSVASGLFVLKAAMLKEEGLRIEDVIKELELLKGTEKASFFVDDLKFLQKGGRISSVKANVGSLLKITPILTIKDGLVDKDGTVRGKKNTFNALINANNINENTSGKTIFIGYCENEDSAIELENKIKEISSNNTIYKVKIGAGVSTHSGPSIVGVASI